MCVDLCNTETCFPHVRICLFQSWRLLTAHTLLAFAIKMYHLSRPVDFCVYPQWACADGLRPLECVVARGHLMLINRGGLYGCAFLLCCIDSRLRK